MEGLNRSQHPISSHGPFRGASQFFRPRLANPCNKAIISPPLRRDLGRFSQTGGARVMGPDPSSCLRLFVIPLHTKRFCKNFCGPLGCQLTACKPNARGPLWAPLFLSACGRPQTPPFPRSAFARKSRPARAWRRSLPHKLLPDPVPKPCDTAPRRADCRHDPRPPCPFRP